MGSTDNSLLNEKYRPTELSDYVGNGSLKSTIAAQLYNNDIQNYLFYGPAGTGKTTLAKLIVNKLDCDSLYINASDERGILLAINTFFSSIFVFCFPIIYEIIF